MRTLALAAALALPLSVDAAAAQTFRIDYLAGGCGNTWSAPRISLPNRTLHWFASDAQNPCGEPAILHFLFLGQPGGPAPFPFSPLPSWTGGPCALTIDVGQPFAVLSVPTLSSSTTVNAPILNLPLLRTPFAMQGVFVHLPQLGPILCAQWISVTPSWTVTPL